MKTNAQNFENHCSQLFRNIRSFVPEIYIQGVADRVSVSRRFHYRREKVHSIKWPHGVHLYQTCAEVRCLQTLSLLTELENQHDFSGDEKLKKRKTRMADLVGASRVKN